MNVAGWVNVAAHWLTAVTFGAATVTGHACTCTCAAGTETEVGAPGTDTGHAVTVACATGTDTAEETCATHIARVGVPRAARP